MVNFSFFFLIVILALPFVSIKQCGLEVVLE